MQVLFSGFFKFRPLVARWWWLAITLAAGIMPAAGDGLRRNAVVLVDVSKSVDTDNQESALSLVAGLVRGEVAPEIREQWRFTPSHPGQPAVENLIRLASPESGESVALARDQARFVLSPLGNYDRVTALRGMLQTPAQGSPAEIAGLLTAEPSPFGATDNSTHISLAEAVVAQAFLGPQAPEPYYLIVISDMFEDCHNSPARDYSDPPRMADLQQRNARVLAGELPFTDGAGRTGKYTAEDIAAVRFRAEKINDFKLGEFTYRGKVGDARLPLRVVVFAPTVKRSLAFTQGGTIRWVLPDKPPAPAVTADGLAMDGKLVITVRGGEGPQEAATIDEKCSLILARRELDLGDLWEREEMKALRRPGKFEVKLAAAGEIGLSVDAVLQVEIAEPVLQAGDAAYRQSIQERPHQVPGDREILSQRIAFVIDPVPTESHKLTVTCGQKEVTAPMAAGRAEVALGELLDTTSAASGPIRVRAELPLRWDRSTAAEAWLQLPARPTVWAEYLGRKVEGNSITLVSARALTLKASHAGMHGMNWLGTTVRDSQGASVALEGDANSLDFADVAPGTYSVTAKFGATDPVEANFTVVVPARTNWMLIALGAMAALAIALLAWHFLRR